MSDTVEAFRKKDATKVQPTVMDRMHAAIGGVQDAVAELQTAADEFHDLSNRIREMTDKLKPSINGALNAFDTQFKEGSGDVLPSFFQRGAKVDDRFDTA